VTKITKRNTKPFLVYRKNNRGTQASLIIVGILEPI